jgi:predicted kinase
MSNRILLILVGLPRSGKSTWAREQAGAAIVNPDAIRLSLHGQPFFAFAEPFVWAIAYLMVKALFFAGHETVIIDATNVTMKRRDEWRTRFSDIAEVQTKVFDTSPEVCKERAGLTDQLYLIPIIERMAKEWDLPKPASWGEK